MPTTRTQRGRRASPRAGHTTAKAAPTTDEIDQDEKDPSSKRKRPRKQSPGAATPEIEKPPPIISSTTENNGPEPATEPKTAPSAAKRVKVDCAVEEQEAMVPMEEDSEINEDKEDDGNDGSEEDGKQLSTQSDKQKEEEEDTVPKFQFRQKVFAKDMHTGLLYEAVIRRLMYGVQNQRQLDVSQVSSEADVQAFFDQEPIPEWHYFVHYNGWNVKWDRWVPEQALYKATDSTRAFAKRLNQELIKIRKELRSKSKGKPNNVRVAAELERNMAQLEREHRLEERRQELALKGVKMEKEEEDAIVRQTEQQKRSKRTKANIRKEISLRAKHLQGRRKHSELLILPTSLKKIMVEEWEIITQCQMFPNIPVKVTVRDALERYYDSKVGKNLEESLSSPSSDSAPPKVEKPVVGGHGNDNTKEKSPQMEWRELVDGVALFFDQALRDRLLYQQELVQVEAFPPELSEKRMSEIYGCEHLLRMFVRLPGLLMGELPESEAKNIINKVKDLVRFLQKNHNEFFPQSHRRYNAEEIKISQSGST